jgi:hypothetical protein
MLTLKYALAAVKAQKQQKLTAEKVVALLIPYNNVSTIANVTQVTLVPLAAANKHITIQKVTKASILLFANELDYTSAIQRSAAKVDNDTTKVATFQKSAASFTHHPHCYSLVENNNSGQKYLYMHYNSADSVYIKNGQLITVEEVASYSTPANAAALLNAPAPIHNKLNDVYHNIQVRTVKLENIVRLAALKQVIQ